MGLFDFVKDAGEKLLSFGGANRKEKELETAATLGKLVGDMGLGSDDMKVTFSDGTATVSGTAPSQEAREKVVLLLGNVAGVGKVDDRLVVEKPEPEAVMYTVRSGDSLSKIAKEHYGDAMKYPAIFEANRPMLKDPNKIYPGQVLRIPRIES
jgi:nucleoid-associated protein YgaU